VPFLYFRNDVLANVAMIATALVTVYTRTVGPIWSSGLELRL